MGVRLFFFLFLSTTSVLAFSQDVKNSFIGKIIVEHIRDIEYNTLDLNFIGSMDHLKDTTYVHYIIDTIHLIKKYHIDGNDTTAYAIITPTLHEYYLYPSGKHRKEKLQEKPQVIKSKTKRDSTLLGFHCSEYEYMWENEFNMTGRSWIAVDFPYESPVKGYESVVSSIFKLEGLEMESFGRSEIGDGIHLIKKTRVLEIIPKIVHHKAPDN